MQIQLQYHLTPDDYYEYQIAYLKHKKSLTPANQRGLRSPTAVIWMAWTVLIVALVVLANVGDAISPPATMPAPERGFFAVFWPYLILIGVFAVYFFWVKRSRFLYRRLASQGMRLGELKTVEITDTQIAIRSAGNAALVDWTYFIRFIETKSEFLLFVLPRMAHIVPKRGFGSANELAEFRDFCLARVGKGAVGFPVGMKETRSEA